jgi:cytochrome c
MDSFEFNKIAGAILASALALFGINELSSIIMAPTIPEKNAYSIEVEASSDSADSSAAEAADTGPSLGTLLASADVAAGQKVFKKCGACHTTDEGGANKIGPNLYGILENNKGASGSFGYSGALKEKGGTWTYADLDAFLTKPKGFIKGTKMSFSGIKKPTDRANVILFLRSLGKDNVALPAAE